MNDERTYHVGDLIVYDAFIDRISDESIKYEIIVEINIESSTVTLLDNLLQIDTVSFIVFEDYFEHFGHSLSRMTGWND